MRPCTRLGLALLMGLAFLLASGTALAQTSPPHTPDYLPDAWVSGGKNMRWNDQTRTISVYIPNSSSLRGWHPRMPAILWQGFMEWQQAMGGRFTFTAAPQPDEADILVQWVGMEQKSSGLASMAQLNRIFTSAQMSISPYDPKGRVTPPQLFYHTCLHEIGHALGIHGHSSNPADVMYFQQSPQVRHLSARDISTMRLVYQRPADITNPPGVPLSRVRAHEDIIRRAEAEARQNNELAALAQYELALAQYPDSEYAHYGAGVVAYNASLYDKAVQHLEALPTHSTLIGPALYQHLLAYSHYQLAYEEYQKPKPNTVLARQHLKTAQTLYQTYLQLPELPTRKRDLAKKNLHHIQNFLAP